MREKTETSKQQKNNMKVKLVTFSFLFQVHQKICLLPVQAKSERINHDKILVLTNSEPASHASHHVSHASHHVSHTRQMLVPSPFFFLRLCVWHEFSVSSLSFQYRFVICFHLFHRLLRYVLYCFVVNKF